MRREMQNLQRKVTDLTNALINQRVISIDDSNEERDCGHVNQKIEEPIENMGYDERVLMALEGRNDGIKMEVLDYAGSLQPEELIDWLISMEICFEWKPMTEEKKLKFACTKLKVHAMIWWDHVQRNKARKGKDKI